MLVLLSILAVACVVMAAIEARKEYVHDKKRKEIKSKRRYTSVPVDAADRLKAFLDEDKSANKEFKLAALVVEDESGHKSIEDIDLRGDSSDPVKLSDYAINKNKFRQDDVLFNHQVLNVIANKVNCIIANTERYYAFEITKENVMGGRHGKTKKSIAKDFVMLLDLNETELSRIANLSF